MNVYTPTNVIVHEVDVHFESRIISKPIHVVQYDDRLPVVKVNLYTGNNGDEQYALPEGADVNIRYCRPDGHVVYNPVLGKDSTSNNVVYFEITQAMLIKNGKGRGVLEVTLNGKLACSSEIIFEIDINPIQEDSIEATDEFKSVVQYAAEAESAASSVRDLTVEAITGEPGSEATVEKSGGTGPEDPYHLTFTIPKGESGSAGNISVVAEEYSASKTYKEGQFVMHNNDLYVAKVDISTAEAWNANHWTRLNIGDALYDQQVEIDHKADIDGSYEDLTAGSAEQLLSSVYVEDNTPYSFRTSGGNLEIGNREEQRKIVGASVVQNQLINPNSSQISGTTAGVTVTNNKDGSYTLTGTKTSNANTYYYLMYSLPVGSKYVICGANTANAGAGGASGGYNLFCAYLGGNSSFAKQQGSQPLIINPSDTTKEGWRLQLQIGNANGAIHTYNDTIRPMVINLTQRFGAEFADWLYSLTRAKYTEILYKLIPELNGGFIPFNTGVMGSVNVSKHRMTEYNLLDEDTVLPSLGFTKQSDGSYYALPSTITNKVIFSNEKLNYSGRYHIRFLCRYASATAGLRFKINYTDGTSTTGTISNPSTTFTEYNLTSTSGKTVKNIEKDYASNIGSYIKDVCISFYYDGERAGEYEPYKTHEYDYDSSVELRGLLRVDSNGNIYADGDEYKADGSVKRRYGIILMRDLTWTKDTTSITTFKTNIPAKMIGAFNIICNRYSTAITGHGWGPNMVNKTIAGVSSITNVYVRDDTYPDVKSFIASLGESIIVYELATPTEETANPFTETQVVDNWGTEEFVDAQGRSIVLPVGHVTDYPQDLKAKLETVPNAPSENGDYLVRQSSNGTEYVPYTDGTRIDNLDEAKADKNGHYEEMTVGNAEQLLSNNYLEDNTAYNFRRTANGKAVGDREIDEIIGGTLVVNQLIKNGNFDGITGWSLNGASATTADNVITLTKTAGTTSGVGYIGQIITIDRTHVYVQTVEVRKTSNYNNTIRLFDNTAYGYDFTFTDTNWHKIARIYKYGNNADLERLFPIWIMGTADSDVSLEAKNCQSIDITQMFGSSTIADYVYNKEVTTALSGISWLYEYFPILNGGYIPYNTGSLQSIMLSKHVMTLFNLDKNQPLWKARWYRGVLQTSAQGISALYMASPEKIKCIPSTTYCIYLPNIERQAVAYISYFDVNGNWISDSNYISILPNIKKNVFNTIANAYYMAWYVIGSSTLTEQETKLVNISFSSDRDGEYEPYTVHEYDLDSSKELRGIPKIDSNGKLYFDGDRYKDGVTRRFVKLTLNGTETQWFKRTIGNAYFSYKVGDYGTIVNASIISDKLVPASISQSNTVMGITIANSTSYSGAFINLRIPNYDTMTLEEFKTWLTSNNITVIYEVTVETTEDATPVPNPQISSPNGTEEYIDPRVEEGTIPFAIPTGHNTQYLQNLRQKLDDLPFAPSEYGDYLVRVSADGIAFIPFANGTQIPTIPTTTDGRYDLVADVANGTVTLSWVARS